MPITYGFFQSGFRCRTHSTSSERRQSLQKRHEKPLATSQAGRAEQSPEPLYFEVLLYENSFHIVAIPVVWGISDILKGKLQNLCSKRCTVKVTNLLDDPLIMYRKKLGFGCCTKFSNLEHCG